MSFLKEFKNIFRKKRASAPVERSAAEIFSEICRHNMWGGEAGTFYSGRAPKQSLRDNSPIS
jgi:hypothetical protein